MDRWISNAWDNIDKDSKADFIRSCRGLAGPTIRGLLRQFIYKEIQFKLPFESKFLDSPDLQSRSTEKPYHSNPILKKTNKFVCRVEGCNLDEYMKYKSCFEAVEARSAKRKMDFSTGN